MIQLEGGIITQQFPLRMGPLRAGMAAQRGEPTHGGTDMAVRGELEGGEDEVEASWKVATSTTCGAARLPPDAAVLDPEHVQQQAGGRRAQG